MARTLTPYDFGVYSLLFATMLVVNGFSNALVSDPVKVFGVHESADTLNEYFACQVIYRFILGLFAATAGFIAVGIVQDAGFHNALAFAICVFAVQFQELVRVFNATRFRWRWVLASDVANHVTRLLLLLLLANAHLLEVDTGLYAIAAGGVVGSLVSTLGGATIKRPSFHRVEAELWRNWAYGKWLLIESVVFVASSQAYLYLIALWVDVESVGAFSAAQTLVGSLNVLLIGITSYSIPVARRSLIHDGYKAWRQWLSKVGLAATGLAAIACVILSIGARPLLGYVFALGYAQYAYLVPMLGLVMVLTVVNSMLSIAFRTAEMPQVGFFAKSVSAVITGVIAYPLIQLWGVAGAATGLIITQLCWLAVYSFHLFLRKTINEQRIDHIKAALRSSASTEGCRAAKIDDDGQVPSLPGHLVKQQ
ncbi:MAG: hypothetical protein A4E19_04215 [Nitrospira sp. SG-bin1]|nr:MAG: hypothetical protein A4E19_04215 [Nitrospira sp. SG-bin1]